MLSRYFVEANESRLDYEDPFESKNSGSEENAEDFHGLFGKLNANQDDYFEEEVDYDGAPLPSYNTRPDLNLFKLNLPVSSVTDSNSTASIIYKGADCEPDRMNCVLKSVDNLRAFLKCLKKSLVLPTSVLKF